MEGGGGWTASVCPVRCVYFQCGTYGSLFPGSEAQSHQHADDNDSQGMEHYQQEPKPRIGTSESLVKFLFALINWDWTVKQGSVVISRVIRNTDLQMSLRLQSQGDARQTTCNLKLWKQVNKKVMRRSLLKSWCQKLGNVNFSYSCKHHHIHSCRFCRCHAGQLVIYCLAQHRLALVPETNNRSI